MLIFFHNILVLHIMCE